MTVNGVEASLSGQTFSAEVPLRGGENLITAQARDLAGNIARHSIRTTLLSEPPTLYEYDPNGCLVRKKKGSEDWSYSYDYENRLISVHNVAQGFSLDFAYDGDKRRIFRASSDGTVTRFLHDGLNVLKDYDGNGNELAT